MVHCNCLKPAFGVPKEAFCGSIYATQAPVFPICGCRTYGDIVKGSTSPKESCAGSTSACEKTAIPLTPLTDISVLTGSLAYQTILNATTSLWNVTGLPSITESCILIHLNIPILKETSISWINVQLSGGTRPEVCSYRKVLSVANLRHLFMGFSIQSRDGCVGQN